METSPEPVASAPAAEPAAGADKRAPKRAAAKVRRDVQEAAARRRRGALLARMPVALGLLAVLVFLAWTGQEPVLRTLARRSPTSSLGAWATQRLAERLDAGSFDIYVRELGRPESDHALYHRLVFLLGGRAAIAEGDLGELLPEDPVAPARHAEVLQEHLASDDPVVLRGTLRALCILKDRPWAYADDLLIAAGRSGLSSEDVVTRRYAAMALRANPDPKPVRAMLARALETDPDGVVRKNAAQGLGMTGDLGLRDVLADSLGDPDPEVRREATIALARLGAPPPLEQLEELLRQDEPLRRADILATIGRHPSDRATAVLVAALREPSSVARRAAIAALGVRDDPAARAGLELALRDPEAEVRVAAALALSTRADGRHAVPAIVAALPQHANRGELSELHEALRTLTGAEIPGPGPEPASWRRVVEAWQAWLAEHGGRVR